MQFIDSHAHLNSPEFKDNWENVVTTAKKAGLSHIINCSGDLADSEWGIAQAEQEPIVYTTVGVHPESLAGQAPNPEQLVNNLRRIIAKSTKAVGIGEIGLDYTLGPAQAPKQAQIDLITPQLNLASDLNLPVVLHVRDQKGSTDCFHDLIQVLQQFTTSKESVKSSVVSRQPNLKSQNSELEPHNLSGVFHCWTGTSDQARIALSLNTFFISFSGILTYKSAGHILDAAAIVPDHRLLIETDSPFLTPEPARSKQHPSTNEPKYVILTAEKLAEVRNTTLSHIAEITTSNAKQLFNLP